MFLDVLATIELTVVAGFRTAARALAGAKSTGVIGLLLTAVGFLLGASGVLGLAFGNLRAIDTGLDLLDSLD